MSDDYKLPFERRFLGAADALSNLDHWLSVIGMSGNETFRRLQTEVIKHGAVTLKDIQREAPKPRSMGL